MKIHKIVFFLCLAFVACSEIEPDDTGKTDTPTTITSYKMSTPRYVFGFGTNKYSYCPSALIQEDGTTEIWFCGNPNDGIMVDNVFHITENADGTVSKPVSVLQPSLSWDSRHTCDPSVIEGEFKMDGTTYKYAMFFLSNPLEYYYNEVGVAFSNDLHATTWVKYPYQIITKGWDFEGDQSLGGTAKSWGTGQPSAFSLDKKGKVCLTYTLGDVGGTRVLWRECDFSDMSNPVIGMAHTVTISGLENSAGGKETYLCNADFAVNLEEDKIVMVRHVSTTNKVYPSYIPVENEINWMSWSEFKSGIGSWKTIYRIKPTDSGFARNHNSCIARDNFGHIKDWETPTSYFTVSKESPDDSATPTGHAEWTYHIYKTKITKRVIEKK